MTDDVKISDEEAEIDTEEFWKDAPFDPPPTLEDVLRAEEHYARTGLHLTWEEVREWLFAYGTPDEKEMPKCHT